jgi:CO/xanthine dehydrogenase FAD-binding subunit
MGAYVRPTNLPQALDALAAQSLTVVAGATDFYPARVGRPIDDDILDISAIADLRGITETDDHWRFGATTTWTDIIEADLPACFDGLKLAAREIGGQQIQNRGTLAGNLCNASPAADGVPPLLTLDARVELCAAHGRREQALATFITGNRRTIRQPDELVTALLVPKPRGTARSHFLKLGARRYLVISIVSVAGIVEVADGNISAARIAVGSCSEVAQRLPALEAALIGAPATTAMADRLMPDHLNGLSPIGDCRGTADYRGDAAVTLVRRLLQQLGSQS